MRNGPPFHIALTVVFRCLIRSERPLAPLEAGVHYDDIKFDFLGNKLSVESSCETQDELAQLIYSKVLERSASVKPPKPIEVKSDPGR